MKNQENIEMGKLNIIYRSRLILLLLNIVSLHAQVGVNILTPHTTAALQIESPSGTFKGLLTPSMTTAQRASIKTGAVIPADGLVVYDVNHHMHYCYNASNNTWVSMSPFSLTTTANSTLTVPNGVISTPSSSSTFSVGINKLNPSQALDVSGSATVSGNISAGGNSTITGNSLVMGSTSVNGSVMVSGFPANPLVPAGVIVMYSGTLIPFGWAVCDGGTYNGLTTPDLRGRFIVGMDNSPGSQIIATGQYVALSSGGQTPSNAPNDGTTLNYGAIGNKGGEAGHTLSLAEMPTHTHSVSATINNSNVFGFNGSGSAWLGNGTSYSGDPQIISASISETPKGSNQIHENRPPYYVLVYIIKLP